MDESSKHSSKFVKKSSDAEARALKVPPHSNEAEQSVLGALMLDPNAWDKVADQLSVKDFYQANHRLIFQALADLAQRNVPFDVVTVAEALKTSNTLEEAGGEVYLFELSKNTPSAANILAYAEIVRNKSILRQLISTCTDIIDSAFSCDGDEVAEILDQAERKVFEIADVQSSRQAGPLPITKLAAKAVTRIEQLFDNKGAITGLSTGFADLDELTCGLQPADLVIIAGRPSMGKTAFAMNIAENAVLKNPKAIQDPKPVLVFSMEMPGDALAMRMISSLGRIDQHRVRTGKIDPQEWPRIVSAVSILSDTPLFIDDSPGLTPLEVRARARRLAKQQGPLGLIILDYLQLMQVPGYKQNRVAEISEISRSLKALAKELNVPVIALSQLNRSLEQRTNRRPVMSDLRESGAIEQDADLIAFIYRDEVYNPESLEKGTAEIIISKQRNGPIGTVRLTFLGHLTRFENHATKNYNNGLFS